VVFLPSQESHSTAALLDCSDQHVDSWRGQGPAVHQKSASGDTTEYVEELSPCPALVRSPIAAVLMEYRKCRSERFSRFYSWDRQSIGFSSLQRRRVAAVGDVLGGAFCAAETARSFSTVISCSSVLAVLLSSRTQ
jgi:hypothetical protein